jgi:flagellar M-ring protein FliF
MRFLKRVMEQFNQVWLGMSVSRRIVLSVCAAASLATIIGVGYWASQPDYRVLFSGLAPEDAGAVTAKLQTQNVAFRLSNSGTTILVPADQVNQLRLDLAMEGLPAKGGKGYEIFDGASLTMTPFMQHLNQGRALQAELAKSIMQLDPVAYARVHIVQPEPSPFIRDKKPTTASVILRLKPGTTLNRSAAAGIVALVSRSVEGLAPEQVALVDSSGRVIIDPHGTEGGAVPNTQLEYKRDVETYLASKAEEMLTPVLGQGRAIVRVTAEINFKTLTETKESFDNEQKAVKKETTQSHKMTNAAALTRAGAGATANLSKPIAGGTPSSATSAAPPPDTEETTDVEYYSPPKTVQHRMEGAGSIERLTIAAMVDRETAQDLKLIDIQDIIKQAVGYKEGRDEIKATEVKLTGPVGATDLEAEWVQSQRWQNYFTLARNASVGIAAFVAFGIGWLVLRRLAPLKQPADRKASASNQTLERMATVAQQDPDAIARVLSIWLGEGEKAAKLAA